MSEDQTPETTPAENTLPSVTTEPSAAPETPEDAALAAPEASVEEEPSEVTAEESDGEPEEPVTQTATALI